MSSGVTGGWNEGSTSYTPSKLNSGSTRGRSERLGSSFCHQVARSTPEAAKTSGTRSVTYACSDCSVISRYNAGVTLSSMWTSYGVGGGR